ncbi:hypothetical protein LTR04_004052 [Oleoguttula sp. CCFEE 6159]|nr:hypothetical protein LTR04_004052 [Oleoguttula sp. CCFEE 6159]
MNIWAEPQISFRIPFDPPRDRMKEKGYSTTERMKIFADEPEALNMSAEIPANILAKLKYTLGVSNTFTLFRVDNEKRRDLFRCAPRKDEIGYQPVVGFSDAASLPPTPLPCSRFYPLHLLNLASVRDVASKLGPTGPRTLDALRFRSNIYVTGPAAFAEDGWKRIRIGSATYHVACRTARCGLPNVDPATGIKDANEPSTTLRAYRCVDEGAGTEGPGRVACLGVQLVPAKELGAVKVGDEVEVLETGEHWFIAGGVEREEQDRLYYALKEKGRKGAG